MANRPAKYASYPHFNPTFSELLGKSRRSAPTYSLPWQIPQGCVRVMFEVGIGDEDLQRTDIKLSLRMICYVGDAAAGPYLRVVNDRTWTSPGELYPDQDPSATNPDRINPELIFDPVDTGLPGHPSIVGKWLRLELQPGIVRTGNMVEASPVVFGVRVSECPDWYEGPTSNHPDYNPPE